MKRQKTHTHISLVVWWLGVHLAIQGTRVQSPSLETKIPHATGQLSTHTATKTQHSQNSKDKIQFQWLKKKVSGPQKSGISLRVTQSEVAQRERASLLNPSTLIYFVLRPGGNPGTWIQMPGSISAHCLVPSGCSLFS